MKNMKSILSLIIFGVTAVVSLSGCGEKLPAGCGDTVKSEVVSPDGRYVATLFERDCGATTNYARHVSLRKAKETFDPSSKSRIFTVEGQPTMVLHWSAERTLEVSASVSAANTFKKLSAWGDVQIVYR